MNDPDIVYAPADRPEVEVYDEWTYHDGEIRAWLWRNGWYANVALTKSAGMTYIKTVPGSFIRGAEVPPAPEVAS